MQLKIDFKTRCFNKRFLILALSKIPTIRIFSFGLCLKTISSYCNCKAINASIEFKNKLRF